MAAVTQTVKLIRAFGRAYDRKWTFLAAFLCTFLVSFSALAALDLVPEAPAPVVTEETRVTPRALTGAVVLAAPENPTRVAIPAVGIDVAIRNPESTDVA